MIGFTLESSKKPFPNLKCSTLPNYSTRAIVFSSIVGTVNLSRGWFSWRMNEFTGVTSSIILMFRN